MFGNCNHCCFCCGHPCTMLGVSLFISCKNKIQCVCVWKKKKRGGQRASKGDGEGAVSTGEGQPGHSGSWNQVRRELQGYVRYSRESNKKNDSEMITRSLRGHWNLGENGFSPCSLPKSSSPLKRGYSVNNRLSCIFGSGYAVVAS